MWTTIESLEIPASAPKPKRAYIPSANTRVPNATATRNPLQILRRFFRTTKLPRYSTTPQHHTLKTDQGVQRKRVSGKRLAQKRRGGDSNPRRRDYRRNGFRDRRIQPLCHLSAPECTVFPHPLQLVQRIAMGFWLLALNCQTFITFKCPRHDDSRSTVRATQKSSSLLPLPYI
jgi:hypothetical protein